jgi:hypothetical protein
MNPRAKASQIYLARLPRHLREKVGKRTPPQELTSANVNPYVRFNNLYESLEEENLEEERGILFDEALDVAAAQAWLNRAYQTVLNRSTSIPNLAEKDEYTKLATVLQAAIPINNATEESVEQNLSILRQQIVVGEQDSETLRKLKSHLISSISEVLAPTEQPTSPEGVATAPEGGAPGEEGMPPGEEANPNPALAGAGAATPSPIPGGGGKPLR